MFDRIMGIVTLKPATYKAVAEDESLTQEAMLIVIVVAVLTGLISGVTTQMITGGSFVSGLLRGVIAIIFGLITWYVAAFLLATVANAMGGKTNINEMLRVTGYVYAFQLVGVLVVLALISPALICLTTPISFAALILSLIGYVIGIREAAEFSTGNAVIVALVVAVVSFIINAIGGFVANML
ncbi:MAG: YIP1 family protein [Anaerolineales bacterium]